MRKKITQAIIALSAAGAFGWACSANSSKEQNIETGQSIPNVEAVPVFALKKDQLEKKISLPGELLPLERVSLYAKVSGFVRKMNVDIGSVVKKGQVLVVLDAPEMQSQLTGSNAQWQAARARYRSSLDTYKRLLRASQTAGVVSSNELERTKNQMLADSAGYESARASARSLGQLENYLTIRAPFDGVITNRYADVGALVSNPGGRPILDLENNTVLRLNVAIPEAAAGSNLNNKKVLFSVKSYPGQDFTATLGRQTQSVDINTRTETWQFDVPNPTGALRPGMFADVKLNLSRNQASFYVPFPAVVTSLEKTFVIRVRNGQTEWIEVGKGMAFEDRVEIFGHLNEGDTLVQRGSEELKPEKKVAVKFESGEKQQALSATK